MFDAVIGQALPKKLLETALSTGKLSHAYIFHGADGIGKTTLALEFAKAIVCEHHTGCGVCAACKQFFSTQDIRILEGDRSISVNQIRELTTEIYLQPFLFSKKIYLIKDAEKMTVGAQNALLKVLEEPPRYAMILLVTNSLSGLLPTILSRGVQIRCPQLSPLELKEYFTKQNLPIPSDEVLALSKGSVTEALALAQSEDYKQMRTAILRDASFLIKNRSSKDVVRLYQDFLTYEKEVSRVTDILLSLIYDASLQDKTHRKNADWSDIPNISLSEASALYEDVKALAKALAHNGNYAISVLGALLRMKGHLCEERIY
ncbi:MAG: DNA polymerase III subunit [Ruminococcaceae bacterium]|nr:DNA polymerase III subunit [Oscillospiraceae bacterium]